ncbi:MAG: multidrug effflux MFS transporter [Hyphomonadaceae bacterium]
MSVSAEEHPPFRLPISFAEFVVMIAALMAIVALGIDAMLPALPHIGEALGVADKNARQWIITAYLLGFGGAHIFYGPLADRFGRKAVMLWTVGGYAVFSVLAAASADFSVLLAARAAQGIAGAATRVVAISIVRDCFVGRRMARVMSLASMVFMAVPILAPGIGTLILMVGDWRWIFGLLALYTGGVFAWALFRLPETLALDQRQPLRADAILKAIAHVLTQRDSIGYTLAQAVMLGGLFGFINSAQQIFFDIFHAPKLFPIVFAFAASAVMVTSLLNARIVMRYGMRRVSHAATIGFLAAAAVHMAFLLAGIENIVVFALLQAVTMGCFGLAMGNFGAMSMEPLGEIAGTGAAVQGLITIVAGTLLGFAIGQCFNGTTMPLVLGYLLSGFATLAIVFVTERGRLFRPHAHGADAQEFAMH